MRTIRHHRPWLVGLAALGLLLAGCGDDGEADDAAQGLTGDPIRIGLAVAESGPQASSNESTVGAAEAWVEQTNADGGLGGRPVEIVTVDTQNDAAAAQAAVKELINQDDVVAMLLVDPVAEGPVSQFVEDADIPVIGAGGYAQDVWNSLPNFFTNSNNSLTVITSEIYAAAAADATVFGAAVCAETATCAEGANAVFGPNADALGVTYAGAITVGASAANYTAECLNFIEKKADAISMIIPVDTSLRLMTDCIQQGYDGIFATAAGSFDTEKFKQIQGAHIVGTLNGFPWWVDDAPVKRFRDAMEKYSPDTLYEHTSATTTWASLELFKKAIGTDTTDVSRDSVFAAYRSIKDETLDGLLPQPLTFTDGQPSPAVECFWQIDYTTGDDHPELIAPSGASGNGADGDLATACASS
jgi:branched-chain amino acid transport system substrate-binding protein